MDLMERRVNLSAQNLWQQQHQQSGQIFCELHTNVRYNTITFLNGLVGSRMNEHGSFLTLLGEIGLRLKGNWRLFDILESFGKAICSSEMFCLTHKKPSNSAKYAKKKCSNGHDRIRNVDFYFKNTYIIKRCYYWREWRQKESDKHWPCVIITAEQCS